MLLNHCLERTGRDWTKVLPTAGWVPYVLRYSRLFELQLNISRQTNIFSTYTYERPDFIQRECLFSTNSGCQCLSFMSFVDRFYPAIDAQIMASTSGHYINHFCTSIDVVYSVCSLNWVRSLNSVKRLGLNDLDGYNSIATILSCDQFIAAEGSWGEHAPFFFNLSSNDKHKCEDSYSHLDIKLFWATCLFHLTRT